MSNIYSKENKLIRDKLVKARITSGKTQREIALKLKKSQSYISKVEAGQIRLTAIDLKNFAKIYKRDISYFYK